MARSPSNKGITNRNANVPPPARNTQDNTRGLIPGLTAGTTYGEGQQIKEQAKVTGMPKDGTPQAQARPTRPMPQMDVFASTQRPSEPVTAGLPFGPGVSPVNNTEAGINEVKSFIYESWLATGDDSLLEYL